MHSASNNFRTTSSTFNNENVNSNNKYVRRDNSSKCMKCGITHGYNQCPAYGRRCLNCNNLNHFSRVCNNVYEVQSEFPQADQSPDQVIYYFHEPNSKWCVDLLINGNKIQFKLDTGADVNVLPRRYLQKIGMTSDSLMKSAVKLRGYSGGDIKVVGRCNIKVKYKDVNYILDFIIADVDSPPILGCQSCQELNLIKLTLAIKWHWTPDHARSFNVLKECLTKPPVLQYYDVNKPVVLSVDASKNGLGACLLQNNLPVSYASRTLTKAEQNYAQIEKELLACVFACEKFYSYIFGKCDVTIETDHKPLVHIIVKPIAEAPPRLQRMLLRLQRYTFTLKYKPGKYLFIADALSRDAEPVSHAQLSNYLDTEAHVSAVIASNPLTDSHFVKLQYCTQNDNELQTLIELIKNGWPEHKQKLNNIVSPYWCYRDELSTAHGLVWKGDRVVIPKVMRDEMLKKIHTGHLGLEKCKLIMRESMFWPNINSQLEDYISKCQACLTFKNENQKETLIPHEVPNRAWLKIGADSFHFQGEKYLIVVDYYSKFVEVVQVESLRSDVIVNHLKNIFSRFGIPETVMSDNGPEFNSKEFRLFAREWNFKHITSSPRYPQSNGQVERTIQTIKNIMKKTRLDKTDFRLALLHYINTPISTTLPSPSELLFSRKLRTTIPYQPRLLRPVIYRNVRNNLVDRQLKQKYYYDKRAKDMCDLVVGQKVKVRFNKQWVSGVVQAILSKRSYLIKLNNGTTLIRNRRHLNLNTSLKNYESLNDSNSDTYDDITVNNSCQPAYSHQPNQITTRSGRTVRQPERWGYSAPGTASM
ncbi:Retrotransposable element Tf2 155 kDa protein type 1 [Papilio machaon]|uniref:RNA-directed DNA polymerase n=1 Tax=Papilio machaon TaxID=76193 RepID=A0A194R9F7_PAPMA|nr:Retrotransposable element Tf2 155 kDa protein type 1 [Papilio machaon]